MVLSIIAWGQPARWQARAAGTVAPDFQAVSVTGEAVQLAAYRGRPVLLNFFSTNCEVSARAVANLNRLHTQRPDVVILAVNLNQASAAEVLQWGQAHGAEFPLIADPTGTITAQYRPYATPFWFFIRPDGVIASVRLGEHRDHNLLYRVNEFLPIALSLLIGH
jgi:peroxiredoxin